MLISIISGTYNRLKHLQAMVATARKSLPPNFIPGVDYEFVIADGGSTDGTLEWMAEQPGIVVLAQGALLGGIAAFNAAGAAAQGLYLVVANDDIEFEGSAIKLGLAHMIDNPDVGAGCFYQDRGGKAWHVEEMTLISPAGEPVSVPYMQVGIIPRWLWDLCGGWGNWEGCHTYGGDNYLSGKIYEAGYKVVPIEGARISDKVANDALRRKNGKEYGTPIWEVFPHGFQIAPTPQHPNPIPALKRVLYAPIIEMGHDIQKKQKTGLREALRALGVVWEVDYKYSHESIVEAAKVWQPHYVITQLHTKDDLSVEEVKTLRTCCKDLMANWSGDVWSDAATPEFLEVLRSYDLQLTVNAALLSKYVSIGIKAAYWQNSFEPPVIDNLDRAEAREVVFLGNNYSGYREKLAQDLKTLPFNVAVYGRGYPDGIAEGESLYDFRKTGQLYRGAKIAIADNQFPEATGFFSDRAWMILAAGGCLMMHQRVEGMAELAGLTAGIHYVEWTDFTDLEAKIRYYLEHEEERRQIAEMGTMETRAHHSFDARVRGLQELFAALPKKRNLISAMMIVKNEVEHIGHNIAQLEEFAAEIVIVDTGSTDGTFEKLTAYANDARIQLHQFPWKDDFSAARNFAKSLCTQDWVFWLDADDRIDPAMIESLKANWPWSARSRGIGDPVAIRVFYSGDRPGESGCMQTRFFKNIPAIEWRGRAMETLDESLEELGITPVGFSGKRITHLTERDPVKQAEKQMRYIAMLKMEKPGPRRDFNIAHCHAAAGRFCEAYLWFREVHKVVPGSPAADFIAFAMGYAANQVGLKGLALECLERSEFPDAYYLRFTLTEGDDAERYGLLRKFLAAGIDPTYPTFAPGWQEAATRQLMRWHARELENLAPALFLVTPQPMGIVFDSLEHVKL